MKKLNLFLFINLSIFSFAQEISKERVVNIVSTLASDEMKGRKFGTPENDKAAEYIASEFKKDNLDYCFGDSYLIPFEYKGQKGFNVCGIKKGTSEKSLAFSGHFDHIGTNNKSGDNIYNGADDDASGISTVIGMADYFKDKKTDHSMVFMAFNAEEIGLIGSKALANDGKLNPVFKNITALFNFEMLATESQFGKNAVFMTGDEFSDFDELINTNAVNGLKIYPDPYKTEQLFYRSDNVNFVKKKIIAHSISTVDMNKATHYHAATDDINIVDVENLTNIINNFAKTIEKLNTKNFAPKYNDKVNFDF
ncbi:M28 family peptidase [Epilithonimonas ginsengisoli]|uniref:M28 family peptidase n=1 Tax=Epilithonimonas ginsengisoli TaxID=1245592 RepID=A0ABU4JJC0_9FLAO|nr:MULTISPECIES: M28 family peptidase [Chryseobacterium group]MBV6880890.1 M28 family peptidase [Epilithonimonas sp. FP105]MDW8549780.1 M28 family peptidase [Epilithonimonas ginsengisoli]OAH66586.1 peptidase M28 [Chryseobacterium sp. FP211-J200]